MGKISDLNGISGVGRYVDNMHYVRIVQETLWTEEGEGEGPSNSTKSESNLEPCATRENANRMCYSRHTLRPSETPRSDRGCLKSWNSLYNP